VHEDGVQINNSCYCFCRAVNCLVLGCSVPSLKLESSSVNVIRI